jgi:hypothetical protein
MNVEDEKMQLQLILQVHRNYEKKKKNRALKSSMQISAEL